MSIPYLRYKDAEVELQKRFGSIPVRVESINTADVFYTDGDATMSCCKLIIENGKYTVYLPQIIYLVDQGYRTIIEEWMKFVESSV